MAKQTASPDKIATKQQTKPQPTVDPLAGMAELAECVKNGEPLLFAKNIQAVQINDPRLSILQRQILIQTIGELQGNKYLQSKTIDIKQSNQACSSEQNCMKPTVNPNAQEVQRQHQSKKGQSKSVWDEIFRSLPREVQEILLRYSVFKVDIARNNQWSLHQIENPSFIDLSAGAELLFKLHQQRGYLDYLILIEKLIIPDMLQKLKQPLIPFFDNLKTIFNPLVWVRNPPPGLNQYKEYVVRLEAARKHAEKGTQRLFDRYRQNKETHDRLNERPSYAFIMGEDRRGSDNRFYSLATQYLGRLANVTVEDHLRTLSEILDYLRNLRDGRPIGTIYIVSHAHRSGHLSFGLNREQPDGFGASELAEAVKTLRINPINIPSIDADTRIIIKGCDAGQDTGILNQLRIAFSGKPTVMAPRHKQIYIQNGHNIVEGMAHSYWVEYPARAQKTPAEQESMLREKYPKIPTRNWRQWMNDSDWTSLVANTYQFTLSYTRPTDLPRTKAMKAEAIRAAFSNFDDYSWTFRVFRTRSGSELVALGVKTTFTVSRPIRDQDGRLHQFELSDETGYGIDERPLPGPESTKVPWKK